MAYLNRWMLIVIGSCAVLAAWLIPPEPFGSERLVRLFDNRTPERLEALRLQREVEALNYELRSRRIAERVSQIMEEAQIEAGERLLRFAPEHDERSQDLIMRWVDGNLGETTPHPEMRFALIFLHQEFGNHEAMARNTTTQEANVFIELDGDSPYCAVVMRYDPNTVILAQESTNDGMRRNLVTRSLNNPLQACAWFGQYGAPGAEIGKWLVDQDFAALAVRGPSPTHRNPGSGFGAPVERGVFGTVSFGGASGPGWSCMAGRLAICEEILGLNGERWRGSGADGGAPNLAYSSNFSYWRGRPAFGMWEYQILATLQRDFGEDAFQAFWTSEASVGEAFESAFGVSAGEWLFEQSRAGGPALEAGPAVDFEDFGLSLLTLFSLMALAVGVAKRRTV